MEQAVNNLVQWPTPLFIVLGTLLGMIFGALPGLGGTTVLALLIPISFGMDSSNAMALFGSAMGGVAFGGSISAILINTPGTPVNAATLLDGYPMTRQGRANEALGVSATASALGAIFGLVVLVLLLPIAQDIILAFGPPEFFWLAIFGLTIIALVTADNIIKGLVSGGIGVLIALIGYSNITGVYRYGFGTEFLWDGFGLIPVIIGLFAIAEVIKLSTEGGTITDEVALSGRRRDVLKGAVYVIKRPTIFLRSAVIGTLVGLVPGAGGTVANFISYLHIKQTSDDPDSFGKGNPDGVIASDGANDAKDGGALLPTIAFGIPGSGSMAVLLGGFILHGLQPGPQLLRTDLDITFTLIFTLLAANVLTSLIGLTFAKNFTYITRIPVERLIPAILAVSIVGTFVLRQNMGDVLIAVAFGFVGYAMMVHDFSRVAFILALVLAPIAENNFLQTMQITKTGYLHFVQNPISIVLILLTVLSILYPALKQRFGRSSVQSSVGGER